MFTFCCGLIMLRVEKHLGVNTYKVYPGFCVFQHNCVAVSKKNHTIFKSPGPMTAYSLLFWVINPARVRADVPPVLWRRHRQEAGQTRLGEPSANSRLNRDRTNAGWTGRTPRPEVK